MHTRRQFLVTAGAAAAAACGGSRPAADVAPPAADQPATVTLAITGMT